MSHRDETDDTGRESDDTEGESAESVPATHNRSIDARTESRTVIPMTPSAPPIHARAGQRRARETTTVRPAMPIRASAPPPPAAASTPSPLRVLHFPVEMAPPLAMVLRRLDGARLCAPDLLATVGWPPGLALDVDAGRPHRLRLRARVNHVGPVAGTKRGHVDNMGRLVLTMSLRIHLGLGEGDPVILWAERDAVGAATGIVAVANAALLEPALAALCALEDAGEPALNQPTRLRTVN